MLHRRRPEPAIPGTIHALPTATTTNENASWKFSAHVQIKIVSLVLKTSSSNPLTKSAYFPRHNAFNSHISLIRIKPILCSNQTIKCNKFEKYLMNPGARQRITGVSYSKAFTARPWQVGQTPD